MRNQPSPYWLPKGEEGLCQLGDVRDLHRRFKAAAGLERVEHRAAQITNGLDAELADKRTAQTPAEELVLVAAVVDAVIHEVHEVRHDGLRTLALEQVDEVVVGKRHVFDENFAHDADARLAERLVQREHVEILDDLAAEAAVVPPGVTAGERGDAVVAPLGVQGVRTAGDFSYGRTRYRQRMSRSP